MNERDENLQIYEDIRHAADFFEGRLTATALSLPFWVLIAWFIWKVFF